MPTRRRPAPPTITTNDWALRLAAKYQDRVGRVDDERDDGHGVWFYLRPGRCTDTGAHVVHESSEARADYVLGDLYECDCNACLAGVAAAP